MFADGVDNVAAGGNALATSAITTLPAAANALDNAAIAPVSLAAESAPTAASKARLRSSNLTHEQKRLICLHAKQNPTLTQAQLGQWAKMRFELASTPSQSSISHTLKRKHNFEHMKSEELASKRMRSVKFPELDVALANWFLHCQARQVKVQGDEIKAKAHLFFEMMGIIHTADPPQFSNGWLHSFQSRHGFSRSPSSSNALGGDLPLITTRRELFAAIEGVAPWDLYWMDETRLLFTMSPDRDAATAGLFDQEINSQQKKITVALCTNADGSDMLDPFFVCTGPLENPASSIVGFQYAYNRNSWMSPTVFREWLLAFDWKMHEENRQIVLLLDSFASHQVKKLALKNVSVRFVASSLAPSASASASQLLAEESLFPSVEKAVFTAVKRRYRHVFLDHVLDRRDERHADIYDVDPLQALQWVIHCWRQVPKTLIAQSFASIGIHIEASTVGNTVEVAQGEEKIDAQILTLLKRLKLNSPMAFDDFLFPAAEHIGDDELTDQDFVDSALNASVSVTVFGSGETAAPRRVSRARASTKKADDRGFAGSAASSRLARNTGGFVAVSQQQTAASAQLPTTVSENSWQQQESPAERSAVAAASTATAMADDEWHTWANSLRVKTASEDFQALQRVIRLATEMNCEPSTVLDLNRMLLEVTQTQALGLPLQVPPRDEVLQSTSVCRFTFGTPNKHVV